MLRDQRKPLVWLLCYSAAVTRSMQIFNSLAYYTIPSWTNGRLFPNWLSIEIGIVAGRLWFNYSEYKHLLSWLGITSDEAEVETSNVTTSTSCGLSIKNSLNFLREWLTYRRQTLDILHTPMGFVCQRRILHKSHSFFSANTTQTRNTCQNPRLRKDSIYTQDNDDDDNESIETDDGMAVFEEHIESKESSHTELANK